MEGSQRVQVADVRVLHVTEKTCPVRVALYTSWGSVTLDPFSFAVMPGTNDVISLGNPILKVLGIDIYDRLGECHRNAATLSVKVYPFKLRCRRQQ